MMSKFFNLWSRKKKDPSLPKLTEGTEVHTDAKERKLSTSSLMSDSSGDIFHNVFEDNIEADGNSEKIQENKTSERPPVPPKPKPKPKPKVSTIEFQPAEQSETDDIKLMSDKPEYTDANQSSSENPTPEMSMSVKDLIGAIEKTYKDVHKKENISQPPSKLSEKMQSDNLPPTEEPDHTSVNDQNVGDTDSVPHTTQHKDSDTGSVPHATQHKDSDTGSVPHTTQHKDSDTGGVPHTTQHKDSDTDSVPHTTQHKDSDTGSVPHATQHKDSDTGSVPHTTQHKDFDTGSVPHTTQHKDSDTGSVLHTAQHKDSDTGSVIHTAQHKDSPTVLTEVYNNTVHTVNSSSLSEVVKASSNETPDGALLAEYQNVSLSSFTEYESGDYSYPLNPQLESLSEDNSNLVSEDLQPSLQSQRLLSDNDFAKKHGDKLSKSSEQQREDKQEHMAAGEVIQEPTGCQNASSQKSHSEVELLENKDLGDNPDLKTKPEAANAQRGSNSSMHRNLYQHHSKSQYSLMPEWQDQRYPAPPFPHQIPDHQRNPQFHYQMSPQAVPDQHGGPMFYQRHFNSEQQLYRPYPFQQQPWNPHTGILMSTPHTGHQEVSLSPSLQSAANTAHKPGDNTPSKTLTSQTKCKATPKKRTGQQSIITAQKPCDGTPPKTVTSQTTTTRPKAPLKNNTGQFADRAPLNTKPQQKDKNQPTHDKKKGTRSELEKGATKSESHSAELLIFVKGIPKSCSAENLKDFLEAKSHGEVKELIFGVEPETAIATLEKNPELTRLQKECKKKSVDGSFLVVHKITKPSAIIVSSEQSVESIDSVRYYFENKKRSDGGDVSKCEKTECGSIIVYFKDEIVVSRVCAKSRSHEVNNVKLTVSPVYRHGEWNVWDVSLHSVHVPEPVSLVDIDQKKLNFLKENKNAMSQLSNRLSNVMAELVLIDDGKVNLKCLLTSTAKDIRVHVKSWKEIAVNTFTEYLSQRIGVQTVKVFSAAWPEFITRIKEINSEDASQVIVISQEIQYTLEIVGHVENVDTLAKHMTQIKQEIEAKVHRKNSQITDSLKIQKMSVLFLLRDQNVFKEICGKFKDLEIEPDFRSGDVKFQGVSEDIQSAKIQVLQESMDLTEGKFGSMSSHQLKLLQRPKVENYIKNKVDAKGLTGRWQVDGSEIITAVLSGVNIESFEKLLEDSILQSEVDLLEKSVPLLTNPMWESKMQELCKDDKILVEYEENMLKTIVLIVSTDDIHDNTVQNVRKFIEENTDLDRSISFDPIKLRYLRNYCGKELEEIENSNDVVTTVEDSEVKLKGTAGQLEIADFKLRAIEKRIIHMPHTIIKPGINKFIHSEKGISIISTVEDQCKCVIRLEDDYVMEAEEGAVAWEEHDFNAARREFSEGGFGTRDAVIKGNYTAKNGSTVHLMKGEIGKQKTDIVVCSTSPNLNLISGAASKSILLEAGQNIQDECLQKYPDKISHGKVAVVGSHDMSCREVYLGFLPTWREEVDVDKSDKTITKFMISCMELATKAGATSISFPAMGTGQLNYPKGAAAELMFNSIQKFDDQNPSSPVKHINFVIYHKDLATIDAFEKTEKSYLNPGLQRFNSSIKAPFQTSRSGIKISVVAGEIAKEKVDLICFISSKLLDLAKGGATGSLLKAGGNTIQDECTNYLKTNHPEGLKVGDLAVVGSGSLPCKKLGFGILPNYTDGKRVAEKALTDFIIRCLTHAHNNKLVSVSFPSIGTGYLKFPPKKVAHLMFKAVENFDTSSIKSPTTLKFIHFVMYPQDQARQAFFDEEKVLRGECFETRKQRMLVDHESETDKERRKPNEFIIRQTCLTVSQGDVTEQRVTAIVRSSSKELSFDRGAVSKAISEKCKFSDLRKECDKKKNKMALEGTVITKSHGLPSPNIIHVEFQSSLQEWKNVMVKCLEKAEKKKFHSVAFPVLGSGKGPVSFEGERIGKMLYEAVSIFAKDGSKKHLKDIRLIVYDVDMTRNIVFAIGNQHSVKAKQVKPVQNVKGKNANIGLTPAMETQVATSMKSTVAMDIYSESKTCILEAQEMLEVKIQNEFITKDVTDECIKDLSKEEIKNIEELMTMYPVEIEVQQSRNRIYLSGTTVIVMDMVDKIQKILRLHREKKNRESQAVMLANAIQWCFQTTTREGTQIQKYDNKTNLRMEMAYRDGKGEVELRDETGVLYIVDMTRMKEYRFDNPEDEVDVLRRDKIIAGTGICLPNSWTPMDDNQEIDVVSLNPSSQNYKAIEKEFMDSVKKGNHAVKIPNVANLKLLEIKRIQNKTLYKQYASKKSQLEAQNKAGTLNERILWHGTAQNVIDSINMNGFNRSYCGLHGCWYGEGVYFTPDASYSARGWLAKPDDASKKQFMYQCLVLTGEYTQGTKGMRVPPSKDSTDGNKLYDSVVDKMANTEEFVIFHDTQAYPQYLVTFQI